jgi:inosose dehydratase
MPTNRRQFLETLTGLGGAALLSQSPLHLATDAARLPISCNSYTWATFFWREGREWGADWDASFAEFKQSGFTAFEPGFVTPDDLRLMLPALQKHGLSVPSAYINSDLHKTGQGEASIQNALAIADLLRPLGTKILVTNPSPIRWGGPENKSDAELTEQAKNLDALGAALRQRGLTLAYHNHDIELRAGAREFHHMLQGTSPRNVKFCFDVHWAYRGCGDSQVALFDILKMYGSRVVELHLRQSVKGAWSETFGAGDIDYQRLKRELDALRVRPLLVYEQCVEDATPKTLSAVEAHRLGLAGVRAVWG